ncbi:MAG TPA: hypothetical protein PKC79_09450 [Solidesulfovibrio magneticus]|nr:hypothetical protein [Solidesulfovibrio magneticus]
MPPDADADRVARAEHDLRAAGQDADSYARSAFELLECRLPSEVMVRDEAMAALLQERLVCLLGSLTHGRRLARELRELGVVL